MSTHTGARVFIEPSLKSDIWTFLPYYIHWKSTSHLRKRDGNRAWILPRFGLLVHFRGCLPWHIILLTHKIYPRNVSWNLKILKVIFYRFVLICKLDITFLAFFFFFSLCQFFFVKLKIYSGWLMNISSFPSPLPEISVYFDLKISFYYVL